MSVDEAAWAEKCEQMARQLEIESHVIRRLMQQIQDETPAYKSKIKLRLYRLASVVNEYREHQRPPATAEGFCTDILDELLPLLEEMGLDVSVKPQGGATCLS